MMTDARRRTETKFLLTAQGRVRPLQKLHGTKPWHTLVRRSHETFADEREAQQALYIGRVTWSDWRRPER